MPHNDKHKKQQELYNKSKELYNAQNPSYLDRLMDFVTMSGPYSMQSVRSDIGTNAPWWIEQDYRNTKYESDLEEARAKGYIDEFSILGTPMFQSMIKDAAADYGGNIQEAAFRNLKPAYGATSFRNIYRNIRGDEPIAMVDGKYRSDERMYGQALGLDYIPKLPKSSYKPSKSENPDAEYYSVMEYLNPAEVLKQLDALNSGFPTEQELREGFYSQGKTYSGRGSKHNVEFSDDPAFGYDKTAARARTLSEKDLETYNDMFHPLENFTMGAGQDDKGTYISIYDKYDIASPTLNKYLQPYEIYDRIYYTTDEQGNRVPMKRHGGQIRNYQNGGPTDPPIYNADLLNVSNLLPEVTVTDQLPNTYQAYMENLRRTNPIAYGATSAQNIAGQTTQDIANFLPFSGEIIDAGLTADALSQGNYGDAALYSAGFMLPFVPGKAIKKGLKEFPNLLKVGKRDAKAVDYVSSINPDALDLRSIQGLTQNLSKGQEAEFMGNLMRIAQRRPNQNFAFNPGSSSISDLIKANKGNPGDYRNILDVTRDVRIGSKNTYDSELGKNLNQYGVFGAVLENLPSTTPGKNIKYVINRGRIANEIAPTTKYKSGFSGDVTVGPNYLEEPLFMNTSPDPIYNMTNNRRVMDVNAANQHNFLGGQMNQMPQYIQSGSRAFIDQGKAQASKLHRMFNPRYNPTNRFGDGLNIRTAKLLDKSFDVPNPIDGTFMKFTDYKYGGNMNKIDNAKRGLWANIHAKRARGEKMRKPGDPGAPTQAQMDRARNAGFGDMFKKLGQQIKTGLTGAVEGVTGGLVPATKLLRPELRQTYADEMKMGNLFGSTVGFLGGAGLFSGAGAANAATGVAGMSSVPGANTFNALYGSGINPAMMNPSLAGQASTGFGFNNLFNLGSNFGLGNTASGMFNIYQQGQEGFAMGGRATNPPFMSAMNSSFTGPLAEPTEKINALKSEIARLEEAFNSARRVQTARGSSSITPTMRDISSQAIKAQEEFKSLTGKNYAQGGKATNMQQNIGQDINVESGELLMSAQGGQFQSMNPKAPIKEVMPGVSLVQGKQSNDNVPVKLPDGETMVFSKRLGYADKGLELIQQYKDLETSPDPDDFIGQQTKQFQLKRIKDKLQKLFKEQESSKSKKIAKRTGNPQIPGAGLGDLFTKAKGFLQSDGFKQFGNKALEFAKDNPEAIYNISQGLFAKDLPQIDASQYMTQFEPDPSLTKIDMDALMAPIRNQVASSQYNILRGGGTPAEKIAASMQLSGKAGSQLAAQEAKGQMLQNQLGLNIFERQAEIDRNNKMLALRLDMMNEQRGAARDMFFKEAVSDMGQYRTSKRGEDFMANLYNQRFGTPTTTTGSTGIGFNFSLGNMSQPSLGNVGLFDNYQGLNE